MLLLGKRHGNSGHERGGEWPHHYMSRTRLVARAPQGKAPVFCSIALALFLGDVTQHVCAVFATEGYLQPCVVLEHLLYERLIKELAVVITSNLQHRWLAGQHIRVRQAQHQGINKATTHGANLGGKVSVDT